MQHPNHIVTEDGSHTLHNEHYGETYHSTFGAETEARHVFLEAAGVQDRLRQHQPTRILEIGFGLGLNALLSVDAATQQGTSLEYHAYENALVSSGQINAMDYVSLVKTPGLHQRCVSAVESANKHPGISPDNLAPVHTSRLNEFAELHLHLSDTTAHDLHAIHGEYFHAIYLDAFSPDTNAECWSPPFISRLSSVLKEDGVLSTYSAKGDVRRALIAADLKVTKHPGPPGKREILVAKR